MPQFDPATTEVLATNLWFGSPNAARLTAGTVALEAIYARRQAVRRFSVNCGRHSATVHCIRDFRLYRKGLRAVRSYLARRRPERVVLLGGGCVVSVPVIAYLRSIYPRLRVVWLDAHGDLHLPSSSRSGYVHGMALGLLLDPATYKMIFSDGPCLTPEDLALCGQKALDPYERQFIADRRIATMACDDRADLSAAGFFGDTPPPPVYVHVDLDVLHPDVYLNPKCDIAAGLDLAKLAEIFSAIRRFAPIVGYSIAENFETDPRKIAELVEKFRFLSL